MRIPTGTDQSLSEEANEAGYALLKQSGERLAQEGLREGEPGAPVTGRGNQKATVVLVHARALF